MEEGFVLDCRKAWVMQEVAVHECSRFLGHSGRELVDGIIIFILLIRVLNHLNTIVTCLLVKLSLHQNVKEGTNSCVLA